MHRSIRLAASHYRALLSSEPATNFFAKVQESLVSAKSGELNAPNRLISYWENVVTSDANRRRIWNEIQQLQEMAAETSDAEMRSLAAEERESFELQLDEAFDELARVVVPKTEIDVLTKCQIELTSGAGGQEAMLFTSELLAMYEKYAIFRGWTWEPLQVEDVPLGGIRSAVISVAGEDSYSSLRFEAGVHRVQRIPVTDTKGRMHTSTASVSVLPEPEEVSVVVPTDSVQIETMRASGPGGQNVNKRSTAVRLTHKETGIVVHCMDERFQHLNIQIAFKRLAAILMQQRVDAMYDKFSSARNLQVGSKARAEKIRTYNFPHDRITDHRIHMQVLNIAEFMRGQDDLHRMITSLGETHYMERLTNIVDKCIIE